MAPDLARLERCDLRWFRLLLGCSWPTWRCTRPREIHPGLHRARDTTRTRATCTAAPEADPPRPGRLPRPALRSRPRLHPRCRTARRRSHRRLGLAPLRRNGRRRTGTRTLAGPGTVSRSGPSPRRSDPLRGLGVEPAPRARSPTVDGSVRIAQSRPLRAGPTARREAANELIPVG